MSSTDLYAAVTRLAEAILPLSDGDLGQPYVWRNHDEEGIRFAVLGSFHELKDLALRIREARLAAGRPLSGAQHALAQVHAGYRDYQALLLGLDEADWDRAPGTGQWPLRRVVAHVAAAQRRFHALVSHGLARARAGEPPAGLPEGEVARVTGSSEAFRTLSESGSLAEMRAYEDARHAAALAEFISITDAESRAETLWWERVPLDLVYRLHRFDAHRRQHAIQVEATRLALGHVPREANRLLRLLYGALAEAEGFALGAEDLVAELMAPVAADLRARSDEVTGAVAGAHATLAAVSAGDAAALAALLAEAPVRARALTDAGLPVAMAAIYAGRPDLAEQILAHVEWPSVWEAAALGKLELLAAYQEDWPGWMNERATDGYTPLQLASYFGQAEAVTWLLDHGAEVAAVSGNPMRLQALHSAAAHGDVAIVTALLDHGADVNARQEGGFTALHAAAQHGDPALVELLLARGADPALATDEGRTAADLALTRDHPDLADRLAPDESSATLTAP